MGQKVNPNIFRLAKTKTGKTWKSSWFADSKTYSKLISEDEKIRNYIEKKCYFAGVVNIGIKRFSKRINIELLVARPGLVIGRGGKELDSMKTDLSRMLSSVSQNKNIDIQVEEFKNPDMSAKLIAEKLAYQLQKRMPYRRAVISAMEKAMAGGALGIKIILAGRINGAEISRREKFAQGKVSLSTIKANLDYYETPSATRSGYIGIKVYLNLPDVITA